DTLVVDYEKTGFDPRRIKHLLTADEIQVRVDLLNALQQYAKTLSQVSSDSKLQEFDDQTKVDERAKGDDALRQTSESMGKLVQAHNELLRAVQTKAGLHADISALISEGQRIKTFYESLQK